MAECNINVYSITAALVEWEPVGEIDGFAEDTFAVEIDFSDEQSNKMRVSSDGRHGTITANNRTNGMVTLKLDPSSPFVGILTNVWQTDRTQRGVMTVTDVESGESWSMSCTVMESLPNMGRGTETPTSFDFPFLFLSNDYTPPAAAVARLSQSS